MLNTISKNLNRQLANRFGYHDRYLPAVRIITEKETEGLYPAQTVGKLFGVNEYPQIRA
jgi:hypothetical protein